MCVIKIHVFTSIGRPPSWSGTALSHGLFSTCRGEKHIQYYYSITYRTQWLTMCRPLNTKTLTWDGGLGCTDANSHPLLTPVPCCKSTVPSCMMLPHPSPCYPWTYPFDHTPLIPHTYAIHEKAKYDLVISEVFLVGHREYPTYYIIQCCHYNKKWCVSVEDIGSKFPQRMMNEWVRYLLQSGYYCTNGQRCRVINAK